MTLKNKDNSPIIGTRKKLLKTGLPNGARTEVNIAQCPDCVLIDTGRDFDFLQSMPEVKAKRSILHKINMSFSGGQFHLKCDYNQYSKVLIEFTAYLEKLVFAAMEKAEALEAQNENKDSSATSDTDAGGNEAGDSSGNTGGNKKNGLKSIVSGVLSDSGRNK